MSPQQQLNKALLISAALVVGLGALAFWPSHKWSPPARPGLKAPIVFDELLTKPAPSTETGTSPGR